MFHKPRIRCRDCDWHAEKNWKGGVIIGPPHNCNSPETRQWNPIDGWIYDVKIKDPEVINEKGGCQHFLPKGTK